MEKCYIVVEGDKKGPYALTQLREMWKSGDITMDAKYATEGMKEWADIGELMEEDNARAKPVDYLPAKMTTQTASVPTTLPSTSAHGKEEIIYADNEFVITRSSFVTPSYLWITPSKTYLMRNITSVSIESKYMGGVIVMIGLVGGPTLGLLFLFLGLAIGISPEWGFKESIVEQVSVGIMILVVLSSLIGAFVDFKMGRTHTLIIVTSAGEKVAVYSTKVKARIDRLVAAIHTAIAASRP